MAEDFCALNGGDAHPPSEPAQSDQSPIARIRKKNYKENSLSPNGASPELLGCNSPNSKRTVQRSRDDTTPARSSKATSSSRDRSTELRRSGSVGRRPGAGIVRELFRIQSQLNNIGVDEQISREDVASQEAIGFAHIFRFSLLTRTVTSETQRRAAVVKEEDASWQLTKKLIGSSLKAIILDQQRERGSVGVSEVVTGDNRLYDRMLRKRQQLGLGGDPLKSIEGESSKLQKAAQLGKEATEHDVKKMKSEVEQLQSELEGCSEVGGESPARARSRKSKDAERAKKQDRLNKLLELISLHEQREEGEQRRAERAVNLKGVDKDVLTGKKTVVASKMEKDLERQRKDFEEEVETALRRALQNERKEGASAAKTARGLNSTVTKLPSISRSVEPPSVVEKPIKGRARAASTVSTRP